MNNITPIRGYAAFRSGNDDAEQSDLFGVPARSWIEQDDWNEEDMEKRAWLVPGYFMRGTVTVLSGPGSAGKSMLTVLYAAAMALDRPVGNFRPAPGLRCTVYNVEDDALEQKRRFSAVLRQFKASPADLVGRVSRSGPIGVGTLLRCDPVSKRLVATDVLATLEQHIIEFRPDVLFLDPMVELHDVEENDNTAIRGFMARLRALAVTYDCCICLLHHARKGAAGTAGDPDSLRGASAIVGAARVVLTVLTMDEDEAKNLGISNDDRRDYFRVDGAKQNYARIEEAEWFRRVPHELRNGDTVAAATPWTPPTLFAEQVPSTLNLALDKISAGPLPGILYTASRRGTSSRWAGQVLHDVCDMNDTQAKLVIAAWLKTGLLSETDFYHPEARRTMRGLVVDNDKRPTE